MTRHSLPIAEAVQANREEEQLEPLVALVGGETAQRAVQQHSLPTLIEEINHA